MLAQNPILNRPETHDPKYTQWSAWTPLVIILPKSEHPPLNLDTGLNIDGAFFLNIKQRMIISHPHQAPQACFYDNEVK